MVQVLRFDQNSAAQNRVKSLRIKASEQSSRITPASSITKNENDMESSKSVSLTKVKDRGGPLFH